MDHTPSPARLLAYDHIGIRVSHQARSLAFYQALGFRESARFERHEANEMVSPDGVRIHLILNGSRRPLAPWRTTCCWMHRSNGRASPIRPLWWTTCRVCSPGWPPAGSRSPKVRTGSAPGVWPCSSATLTALSWNSTS